jgi:hypothetical protein
MILCRSRGEPSRARQWACALEQPANWVSGANACEEGQRRAEHRTRVEPVRLRASLFQPHLSIILMRE